MIDQELHPGKLKLLGILNPTIENAMKPKIQSVKISNITTFIETNLELSFDFTPVFS